MIKLKFMKFVIRILMEIAANTAESMKTSRFTVYRKEAVSIINEIDRELEEYE